MDWQPISSAPKDGTEILLCVAGFVPALGCWFDPDKAQLRCSGWARPKAGWMSVSPDTFSDDEMLREYLISTRYHPTHWMPLPAPPEQSQ